jgi:hypothetical protein
VEGHDGRVDGFEKRAARGASGIGMLSSCCLLISVQQEIGTVAGGSAVGNQVTVIIRTQEEGSILKDAIGRDWKAKLSPVLYIVAVIATLRSSWMAQAVLAIAALIWLILDRRIEKRLAVSGTLAIGPQ